MINVLINAYACNPNWGSEPGMGWNWIVNLANYCNLYVITEGEWKDNIEEAVSHLPQRDNIHFYYNSLPENIRAMCRNQGDWRFYYYYKKWQKKTFEITKQIIKDHPIDILHQLNMIGFREPGYLWKITDKPFVWGPVGGMENMPLGYLERATLKQKTTVRLKNIINTIQIKYSSRVKHAFNRADILVASATGIKEIIEINYNKNSILINETGCYPDKLVNEDVDKSNKDTFDILWVGKFYFRKQLGMALHAISKIKHLKGIRLQIVGDGTDEDIRFYKELADKLGLNNICIWYGLIPNIEVHRMMQKSDLFLFTSIMEGTPHVVLEAIRNNLPVLCMDCCGQGSVVNETIGCKIQVSSLSQSVNELSDKMEYLYNNRNVLTEMSAACSKRQQELSWDSKARDMVQIYEQALTKFKK